MEQKEFEKRLKGINPQLDVIFSDDKKVIRIVFTDDNDDNWDHDMPHHIFDFESGTLHEGNGCLSEFELDQLKKLLTDSYAFLEGPDLFENNDLEDSPNYLVNNNHFQKYTDHLAKVLQQKNNAYGDSFGKSLDKDGLLVLKIRLGDKFNRVSSLIKKGELKENDESLEDTLLDMAGYSILGLKYLKEHENA